MDMLRRTFLWTSLTTLTRAAFAVPRIEVGPREEFLSALCALRQHASAENWGTPRYAQFHTSATNESDAMASLCAQAASYHEAFDRIEAPLRLTLQSGTAGNAIATLHYPGGHNAVFVATPGREVAPSGIVRFAASHGEISSGAVVVHGETGAGRALPFEDSGITPLYRTRNENRPRAEAIRLLFERAC